MCAWTWWVKGKKPTVFYWHYLADIKRNIIYFIQRIGRNNMLVLGRRPQEAVIIGDQISVKVLGVQGNQVRLGITAPSEVSVHRAEIYLKIQQEKERGRLSEPDASKIG